MLRLATATAVGLTGAVVGVVGLASSAEASPPQYAVVGSTATPGDTMGGVAVDPARGLVYLAVRTANQVQVYDEATMTLQRTIAVPNQPLGVAVGPTGVVYVTEYTGATLPGAVAVIPPGSSTVADSLPTGDGPSGVTISKDGTRLWVANSTASSDPATGSLSSYDLTDPAAPVALTETVMPGPVETVTESPDGSLLYLGTNNTSVYVVSATTGAVQQTWSGLGGAHQVTFSADGDTALVSTQLGSTAPLYSTSTGSSAGSLPLANTYYQSVDTALDTTFVTQPYSNGGSVAIVDNSSLDNPSQAVTQTIPGLRLANYIATDPVTHFTFVSTTTAGIMSKIAPTGPAITKNPADQTITDGQSATFTAAATATGTQPMSVQWQRMVPSETGGSAWTDIPGATDTSYTATFGLGDDGTAFRAIFTEAAGQAITNVAHLTVKATPPVVTQDPDDETILDGQSATFTAAASTGTQPITAQWQQSTDHGTTWIDVPGATDTSYTASFTVADSGTEFRAVFTNVAGTATTHPATLTVTAPTTEPTPPPTADPAPPSPGTPAKPTKPAKPRKPAPPRDGVHVTTGRNESVPSVETAAVDDHGNGPRGLIAGIVALGAAASTAATAGVTVAARRRRRS